MYETIVSTFALVIAAVTAWLTLFRRGVVKMTHPSMIFLVQDGEDAIQKVVLRSLLYCTADRGRAIENMYVVLRRGEQAAPFAFWSYDVDKRLERGGGLFVGREGIATTHHFVLLSKSDPFGYQAGEYGLEVFVTLVGETTPRKLTEARIEVTAAIAESLNTKTGGVMFNWNPQVGEYVAEPTPNPLRLRRDVG